jgi:transcription elongation factor GreA
MPATLARPRAQSKDRVELGCRVVVLEARSRQAHTLTLVNPGEADPEGDRVSTDSPLGQVLLGRRPGESIIVQAPIGELHYHILEIGLPQRR